MEKNKTKILYIEMRTIMIVQIVPFLFLLQLISISVLVFKFEYDTSALLWKYSNRDVLFERFLFWLFHTIIYLYIMQLPYNFFDAMSCHSLSISTTLQLINRILISFHFISFHFISFHFIFAIDRIESIDDVQKDERREI